MTALSTTGLRLREGIREHFFEHPPLRALVLSRTRPDDVKELVHYRGARQRYTQIRYGSPGSVRITVVLDEVKPGDVDLYVDADRNRRIEEKDRVAGERRTWRLPMAVAVVEGDTGSATMLIPNSSVWPKAFPPLTPAPASKAVNALA